MIKNAAARASLARLPIHPPAAEGVATIAHQDESRQDHTPDKPEMAVPVAAPNHRDLYVLIIGLLLGILLGPGVLGRAAPQVWERYFLDPVTAQADLAAFERQVQETAPERDQMVRDLIESGASPAALTEVDEVQRQQQQVRRAQMQRRLDRAWRNHGRMLALIIAIAAVMVLECMLTPTAPASAARLAKVRYALIALWLALLLAMPAIATGVSILFIVLLLVVALVMAYVPMGRRRAA